MYRTVGDDIDDMKDEITRLREGLKVAEQYVLWCIGKRKTTEEVSPERVLRAIRKALKE